MIVLNILRWVLRIVLPIAVLGGAGYYAYWLIENQPEPRRYQREPDPVHVKAARLQRQDYQVRIKTQGTVHPRTESTLIPQVSGRVVEVADSFRDGGFFEKGEVLLRIDPSDYETALTIAKSELARAKLTLSQEEARADQARRDWERLGDGEKPSPLTLREPQLAEAKAAVEAAKARVAEAERNLKRTEISAPYAGRVEEKLVDVGNYVGPGTQLASIYAVDYAEIRLPLSNRQLAFLDLPELYRGQTPEDRERGPTVELTAGVGGETYTWRGRIVRTEGSVDTRSRQLFAIAQVDDPYAQSVPGRPPLKKGMFVEASIRGRLLKDVMVVPRTALRRGQEVLVVSEEGTLARQQIKVAWSDEQSIVVREGLDAGQRLCLTQVTYAAEGAPVDVELVDGGIREAKADNAAEPAEEQATEDETRGSS